MTFTDAGPPGAAQYKAAELWVQYVGRIAAFVFIPSIQKSEAATVDDPMYTATDPEF